MKKLTPYANASSRGGFTLVELLIVVIILAVLAAIVVPQFSSSTQEAKEAALRSTLIEMRNAVELYYHQHNSTYPGAVDESGGTPTPSTVDTVDDAFLNQLTRYTDINGKTSNVKDLTVTPQIKYGPYLKRDTIPVNPIDDSAAVTFILSSNTDAGKLDHPLAEPADGSMGWWFDVVSGKFVANTPGKGLDNTFYYQW
ncbi:MAG: prepilin-type N-terminal cleavage/methylation domain-containing protein [Desulfobulbales bacterium]|nr:prepilin-type N-terminal cleavage/methylation domain-containing protein [Desulfobulbales bacterium]